MKINRLFKSINPTRRLHFIGQDYYHNKHSILLENEILKNPRWYTAYTPYQSEISQGRLELTYNYQEIIKKITGNHISNAGLLTMLIAYSKQYALLLVVISVPKKSY